ncbi:hypothetical protein LEP1GSC132_0991 [Leptospira kirschneri str. 200803703]|nr:hypothetical protein LEP1GSC044_3351 [Leptospira kirschneri serovar Grippotyphosa str. RM52]EKO53373.1 hypothetical protein LEP1GSC131_3818 [Leptospira kirschneri str. 200802841]EKP06139.1 hypothetical protein LEP1GSC018_1967 [Leptospira kirschneri str. 2008720114]EKQ85772.1 hypothetical protein LEP1GSC064_2661 [Leptospira kirschneri serovar Grippotyphosa str. Moskva]EKR09088.1 hypothetical protein LEP1GSC122_0777 [Leptospira kirschneri serovar Valbuzzi str. 200702274]EMJ91442.1 hypothetica
MEVVIGKIFFFRLLFKIFGANVLFPPFHGLKMKFLSDYFNLR